MCRVVVPVILACCLVTHVTGDWFLIVGGGKSQFLLLQLIIRLLINLHQIRIDGQLRKANDKLTLECLIINANRNKVIDIIWIIVMCAECRIILIAKTLVLATKDLSKMVCKGLVCAWFAFVFISFLRFRLNFLIIFVKVLFILLLKLKGLYAIVKFLHFWLGLNFPLFLRIWSVFDWSLLYFCWFIVILVIVEDVI